MPCCLRCGWTGLLCLIAVLAAGGCSDLSGPQWFAPGTAQEQQRRAQRFDPYPDPQVGREDGSTRPRGFQNPPPEGDSRARSLPSPVRPR